MWMEYDLPRMDCDTRFSLWKVKMRTILTHAFVDDDLDKFIKKDSKS